MSLRCLQSRVSRGLCPAPAALWWPRWSQFPAGQSRGVPLPSELPTPGKRAAPSLLQSSAPAPATHARHRHHTHHLRHCQGTIHAMAEERPGGQGKRLAGERRAKPLCARRQGGRRRNRTCSCVCRAIALCSQSGMWCFCGGGLRDESLFITLPSRTLRRAADASARRILAPSSALSCST